MTTFHATLRTVASRLSHRSRNGIILASLVVAAIGLAYIQTPLGLVWDLVLVGGLCLVLSVIVGVHEASHMVVGRILGIHSDQFSFGFGPEIIGTDRVGIRWSWRAIPLGGFVHLTGEGDTSVVGGLAAARLWKVLLVYLAGPVSNIILAIIAVSILALSSGVTVANLPWAITAAFGLLIGGTINAISAWLPQAATDPGGMPFGGVPTMIGAVDSAIKSGGFMVGVLFVMLNLSIGLMNLLPIPPLDGGQAALAMGRSFMGPRLPKVAINRIVRGGFVGLVAFMVVINVVDVLRWTVGGFVLAK